MSDVEGFVRFCESDLGAAVMDREAAYLDRFFDPDDRVLDVGAGIGSTEERLPEDDIVGLDSSEEMVRAARARVGGQFIVGDARAIPLTANAVDAVFFVATLEFIPSTEAVLSEAVRVLKPDAILAALVLNTRSPYVRSGLQREGSYFQQLVHRDTEELAARIAEYVAAEREYFLGIRDRTVFETDDPDEAAILAVYGTPLP